MEVHISRRSACWDDVLEDYVDRQVIHLADRLRRRDLRATTLHFSISDGGHDQIECRATLHVPGTLLHASVTSRSEFISVRDSFRELRRQLQRLGVRQLPRPAKIRRVLESSEETYVRSA